MSELASMKKRLAACERKIADLEAQKRQSDFEIKAVRAQSEQRGNALRDLVARFCPLVSVLGGSFLNNLVLD